MHKHIISSWVGYLFYADLTLGRKFSQLAVKTAPWWTKSAEKEYIIYIDLISSLTLLTASPIALASLSPVNLNMKLTIWPSFQISYSIYLAKGFSPQHSVFFGPARAFLNKSVNHQGKTFELYIHLTKEKRAPALSSRRSFFGTDRHNTPGRQDPNYQGFSWI